MKFYSKGGRKRLTKIWKDNNLDQETIFSGWVGVGPSRTLIMEKVSDYMHNFFQFINKSEYLRMNLRLMLLHHTIAMSAYQNSFWKLDGEASKTCKKLRDLSFQSISGAHQAHYHETVEKRVKEREIEERKRIRDLIIQGKLEPPEGFKNVLLMLNTLDQKVQQLEQLEATKQDRNTFGDLPKIIDCNNQTSFKNRNSTKGCPKVQGAKTYLRPNEHWDTLLDKLPSSKPRDLDKEIDARLSTLQEIVETSVDNLKNIPPAPSVQIQMQLSVESNRDGEDTWESPSFPETSSSWHLDEDHSRCYILDIQDDEIFAEAEMNDYYGTSGEIEYTLDFVQVPLLVEDAFDENNTTTSMFDKAGEAVWAYHRQVLTAKDKMKKLSRLINPYYFYY
ncbi:unnamed protein product [Allacma fusca]|uniref:Uncharacterized protein n=1 Tax=Allacma fusca TaxID=39272 RepID=A0A8J2LR25_9HEXA|nr:unnamed protein product [Allacma fusca]